MSVGIVRVQKMTAAAVKGIEIHDRREKDKSLTNPDIDFSKSELNYDLHADQIEDFKDAVQSRIDELDLKRGIRKDAVVMAQVLVTADRAFFDRLQEETKESAMNAAYECYATGMPFSESCMEYKNRTKDFFRDAYEFLAERYGRENIISATVHMDESTPHMHFNFVPVTKDGRLCAKEVLSKATLTEQQTAFHEQVGQRYGLDRGEPKGSGKRRKHLETAEYKAYMATIQEAEQRAAEAVKKAEEAEKALLPLQERREALEADIAVLEQDLPVLHDQIDEAQEELQLLNEAITEKNHEGERRLGMDEWMRRVAEKKAESQDKAELNLLRRFVAEMPGVKALWQQFMQLINAQREREKRKHRKQPSHDGH